MTTPSSIDKTKRYRQRCKRRLRTLFVKPSPLNLSSHDYFRLSSHPYVYAQGIAFSIRWGSGYLPTRILPHYEETLHKIEAKLAALLGHEVTTLFEPNPDIVLPPHIDNTPYLGVEGTHGFGLRTEETLVCHFPKSFGSYATVIASSRSAKETLFEKNPILHKEQYLAPLLLGMLDATLHILPTLQAERTRLTHLKRRLETTLLKKGIPLLPTPLPALIFSYSTTLHTYLIEHNFIPAVTKTQLILYLHTHLTEAHLNTLIYVLAAYREPLYIEAL